MPLTADEVRWSYWLFLGRKPESEQVIAAQQAYYDTIDDIRKAFTDTSEFKTLVRQPSRQAIGAFLLPRPERGRIVIEIPSLEMPMSQMCTYSQMTEEDYVRFCREAGISSSRMHRKYWEWAYIYRMLEIHGMLSTGHKGLVFAVGEEPLPSMLAKRGVNVMATDGPKEVAAYWRTGKQYADELKTLWHEGIVDWTTFESRVRHGFADMRRIPADLRGFDFVWSSCSLEHLGSLRAGMDFVIASLDTLRPGGLAIHTTEFNLSSNDDTVDGSPTSIYRRRDMEQLTAEVASLGHQVMPWNFFPGDAALDAHVDFPPYGDPHLRVALLNYVTTSIGIVIRKAL